MRAYFAFVKKEWLEHWRTYKLLIMVMAFLFFGILGPLIAKLTPRILESLMTEGMQITVAEPTAFDSWAQFFKNVSQMGLIVTSILFSTMMSHEFSSGTLINILTKGVARHTIIWSKFTVASLIWTISYMVCFGLSYAYTLYFWGNEGIYNLGMAIMALWLFGLLFLAIIVLGGVVVKSSYGTLMFALGFMGILFIINMIPPIKEYNPLALMTENMAMLKGNFSSEQLVFPVLFSLIMTVVALLSATIIFNRKPISK